MDTRVTELHCINAIRNLVLLGWPRVNISEPMMKRRHSLFRSLCNRQSSTEAC